MAVLLAASATSSAQVATPPADDAVLDVVAFGSCARQDKPLPIFDTIADHEPDVFLFIGDNMYADLERFERTITPDDVAKAYVELAKADPFDRFRRDVPIFATWDDHDYGLNDAGVELPFKDTSQTLLLQFFREPTDSPRWDRAGVYGSWEFGPEDRRVQIILLDTRYHRDAFDQRPGGRPPGRGPYIATGDTGRTMLGETQWTWLKRELERPADLRLIASSIQVVAHEHGWETWGHMPHERTRLFHAIGSAGAEGVVFLTGDRHLMEISKTQGPDTPYPIWDFTSSGLNEDTKPVDEDNLYRVGPVFRGTNFGLVRIDWDADPVTITLEGRGAEDQVITRQTVALSELRLSDP